jgi:hypothetical protein
MAGVMALLRQGRPSWSVEELKALAMNTADHDLFTGLNLTGKKYGVARVGAGRVDVPNALADDAVAFADDGSGKVSVSFGAVEVAGTLQLDRTVRVENKGETPATYAIAYDPRTTIPGVSYSFPDGGAVTVPAGGSATFRVRLDADASLMHNTHDATIDLLQGGNPRQWVSEASGLITLTPGSGTPLRVPVYAAARPASSMTTAQGDLLFSTGAGSTTLNLAGTGVSTGALGANEHNSVVTPLELALVSPLADLAPGVSELARDADLRYVGVTAARRAASNPSRVNNSTIYFGVVTHGNWSTAATEEGINIFIDTDRNGTDDFALFNTRLTDSDVFVSALQPLPSGPASVQGFTNVFGATVPTALFNSNVLVLPVVASALGMGASTRFNYHITTTSRFWGGVDSTGTLTYDYAYPGVDFLGGAAVNPVFTDQPGGTIPATLDATAFTANASQGVLLLHHYNATGARAQVLPVVVKQSTTLTLDPVSAQYSDPFSLTAHVSPATNGSHTPQGSVEFFVAGVSVGTATPNASGDATLSGIANLRDLGPYLVGATYTSSDGYFAGGTGSGALTVTQEDARATYMGQQLVSTSAATSSTASVGLSASVRDITADAGDPAYDPAAGDIRKATVRFVNRDAGDATLCTATAVQLVDAADPKTGTAACTWIASLGAADAIHVTVGIVVGGHYIRDASADDAVVTVARPGTGSIAGGGYIVNSSSAGAYAGDGGAKTSFDLNAKAMKNGGQVKGHVDVVVQSGGKTYRVESDAISSLATTADTSKTGAASFSGKATLTDVTNRASPVTVEAHATVEVVMTDRGEPGANDSIGLTLWSETNRLLYSSNWNGSTTVEQKLGGGNLQVR